MRFIAQVVLGGDLLRQHQVEARLRLARVGDGGGADLEVALGRGQLLGRSPPCARASKAERVLRGQHVEVGLRHADDQVLAGGRQLVFGQVALALALR